MAEPFFAALAKSTNALKSPLYLPMAIAINHSCWRVEKLTAPLVLYRVRAQFQDVPFHQVGRLPENRVGNIVFAVRLGLRP